MKNETIVFINDRLLKMFDDPSLTIDNDLFKTKLIF